jgi:hypothetical protein
MSFSKGRNVPPSIPMNDLEESLESIVYYFDENWLNEENNHPLQRLWKRKDPLATNELYTFGNSIISLKDVDNHWLKSTLKKIKNGDRNNIIGFTFEIIAAAMIKNGKNQNLRLPPVNNQGYDLIAEFKDNSIINISCKNHGLSDRNKGFIKDSQAVEKLFLEICKKYKKNRIQCHIANISKEYAEHYDWRNLKTQLKSKIKNFEGEELHCVIEKTWAVALSPIEDKRKISSNYMNYNFSVISPFHEYERSSLYQKFEKACDELDKCGIKQSDDKINVIFIHLSENANLNACFKWAEDYLKEHTDDKLIAGIFFIQNVVATNVEKGESFIAVGAKCAINDHYRLWLNKNLRERVMDVQIAVAADISEEPPQYKFFLNKKEVNSESIDPNNSYLYQNGKLFIENEDDKKVTLGSIGPGFQEYLIMPSKEGDGCIKPNLPPNDKLILI